jgi:hypothetical protein
MPVYEVINYAKPTRIVGLCDSEGFNTLVYEAYEEGYEYLVLKLKELKASLCT